MFDTAKLAICFLWLLFAGQAVLAASDPASPGDEAAVAEEQGNVNVMRAFTSREVVESDIVAIDDRTKRVIMFVLAIPLLLLLIATVALGVAMVVYGKQVFLAHMICAGLSLTLALGHAVVGIVWFYPF